MRRRLVAWAVLVSALGCDTGGSATLIVQVRTDLLPVVELATIETMLGPEGTPIRFDVDTTQPFGSGVRVAEIPVSAGVHLATVTALRPDEMTIVSRPVRVDVAADDVRVVTVLLTRDCAGVSCPGTGDPESLSACLGGRCVEETCTEDDPESCAPAECESDTECPVPPDVCATATCTSSGACFTILDHMGCGPMRACDATRGCIGVGGPDAGTPDAGTPDAGTPDAGTPDAGTPDGGERDASLPIDGGSCSSDSDCGFRGECFSGTCYMCACPPMARCELIGREPPSCTAATCEVCAIFE